MTHPSTPPFHDHFEDAADHILARTHSTENTRLFYAAEHSAFVRFNHSKVRQPGDVVQVNVTLSLARDGREASVSTTLTGDASTDHPRLDAALATLREQLPHLPPDPHLLLPEYDDRQDTRRDRHLADPRTIAALVSEHAHDLDLVGIYAAGEIFQGFASSRGQRDTFASHTFNFDWSLFAHEDKAVSDNNAGEVWDPNVFIQQLHDARRQLDVVRRPVVNIQPGRHRVALMPDALRMILSVLSYRGFGLKAQRTFATPLRRILNGNATLHPSVQLTEATANGVGPHFSSQGFRRPPRVALIRDGALVGALVSPRSAREFDVAHTGSDRECPNALALAGGHLDHNDLTEALGTGILISNLWYLNISDPESCRITGMTRFATVWVEEGVVQGPIPVMRFDDSLYRILGSELEALTQHPERFLSTLTIGQRSTGSVDTPGALIRAMTFTL